MMKKPSSPARTAQPPHRRLLLSRDNKQHGIIRRALTLTAIVSSISGEGQEGSEMNSHHNSSLNVQRSRAAWRRESGIKTMCIGVWLPSPTAVVYSTIG